jgi:hypothetical protein
MKSHTSILAKNQQIPPLSIQFSKPQANYHGRGEAGTTEEFLTFEQLLRQRTVDSDQTPLLAYPKTRLRVSDYELVTGATLNRFVDGAAKALLESGFPPAVKFHLKQDLQYFEGYLTRFSTRKR